MKAGRPVYVVAAEAAPVGRIAARAGELGQAEHEVLAPLVTRALAKAGYSVCDVDTACFSAPTPATRQLGFSTFMAARLGLSCKGQVGEFSALGMTGGLAFDAAASDIALGRADVALALGVAYSTNADFATIMDHSVRSVGDAEFQSPIGITPIAWYAFDMARYCHETGIARETIAHVAVKSRVAAAGNPLAQYREPITIEEILRQRPIVEPLGRLEVPAIADGAICLVLASRPTGASIRVRGRGYCHEGFHQIDGRRHDMTAFPAARRATEAALSDADVALGDIGVAEIYAPCTITEVLASEAMGFFPRGQGALAARDGVSAPHGRKPINTSGGCLARGHPPSLTGLYGILEIYEQLTQQAGARQVANVQLGLHACELGNYNAALVHVLEAA